MPKVNPVDPGVDYSASDTMHDIDLYAHGPTQYDFNGPIPLVKDNTLNHMFPKGYTTKANLKKDSRKYITIYNIWQQCIQIIAEHWDYEGLPEGLNKYIIEKMLNENGSVAWFKKYGKIYALPYTIKDKNLYGSPVKVTTKSDATDFNANEVTEFVIMNDTLDQIPLFNKIIAAVEASVSTLMELNKNLYAAAPKGLMIEELNSDDNNGVTDSLNTMIKSSQTFFSFKMSSEAINDFQQRISNNKGSQVYIPIELRDRTEELIKQYLFWQQHIKEIMGLDVDFNLDKPERKIVGEIATQQGKSYFINEHRFNMRKMAIDEINKKLGTNITIKLNEIETNSLNGNDNQEEKPDADKQ